MAKGRLANSRSFTSKRLSLLGESLAEYIKKDKVMPHNAVLLQCGFHEAGLIAGWRATRPRRSPCVA